MNNLSVRSLQGLLLLFVDNCNDFVKKNEELCNPNIKKLDVMINGTPHQFFAGGLLGRDIYPEIKKIFLQRNSDVTWEEFLTTKSGLWVDTRLSTDSALHGSGKAVEKGILLQIEKVPETSTGDLTCYVFSLEDAVAHLSVTDPNRVLTIGK